MRIGENLPPVWQNIAVVLWVAGYGLTFVAALSVLWDWHVVGLVSCGVLVASAIDERKGIRLAIAGATPRADRAFAVYLLTLTSISAITNGVVVFLWLTKG